MVETTDAGMHFHGLARGGGGSPLRECLEGLLEGSQPSLFQVSVFDSAWAQDFLVSQTPKKRALLLKRSS